MKDRIKIIMEHENLTPAKFADRLQINRAIISHILNGRNNPSLDVVTKILTEMHYINPDWLLNGSGTIYKEGVDREKIPAEPDLFHQEDARSDSRSADVEIAEEEPLKQRPNSFQDDVNEGYKAPEKRFRKVTQIIIYYSDNTFETFSPG